MYDYPSAESRPQKVKYGNHYVMDEYEWMRDADSRDTIEFTDKQNDYTENYFEHHKEYFDHFLEEQKKMTRILSFKEIIRMDQGICAIAQQADGISNTVILDDQFCVKNVITDTDFLENIHIHGILPNPAGKNLFLLFALRDQAERTSGLIYDSEKKEILAELEDTFSLGWSVCGNYAYYCQAMHRDDGTVSNTLSCYDIHTNKKESLYTYSGHAAYGTVFPMDDGGIGVNFAVDYHSGETVILDKDHNITVIPYDGNSREYIGSLGKKHYFITDENAAFGKIVAVGNEFDFENAEVCIEERNKKISQAGICNGKIVCIFEYAGSQSMRVFDKTGKENKIKLPGKHGKIDIAVQEFHSKKPIFTYESFTVPSCVLELDTENYSAQIVYKSAEPCKNIEEDLVYYTSQDGIRLPAYIVRKKGIKRNGKNRVLFYGYGGYNSSNYVSSTVCGMSVAKWVENGGVYIHCIIRGGGEFGEEWHRGGWKKNKKNVFNDFCDIVEGVISDNWTTPSRIAICGLSNGGLLMTALITRRPELFGCVIASVPQTDLLGFVYDDRGPMYITEYGDPREDDMFEYMKSYSPYHNVKKDVSYPGIYIQAGAMDNNVPAYHAKKFTAKMQAIGGKRPVLLRVLPFGSHDRGTGNYFHKTVAEMRTFIEIELSRGGKVVG